MDEGSETITILATNPSSLLSALLALMDHFPLKTQACKIEAHPLPHLQKPTEQPRNQTVGLVQFRQIWRLVQSLTFHSSLLRHTWSFLPTLTPDQIKHELEYRIALGGDIALSEGVQTKKATNSRKQQIVFILFQAHKGYVYQKSYD
jgi:hypothetical protein